MIQLTEMLVGNIPNLDDIFCTVVTGKLIKNRKWEREKGNIKGSTTSSQQKRNDTDCVNLITLRIVSLPVLWSVPSDDTII